MQIFSSKLRHLSGDSLEQRLVRYGAMAAAVALGGGTTEAAIIHHVAPDGSTTANNTGIRFDLISGNVSVVPDSSGRAAGANLPSFGALFLLNGRFNSFTSSTSTTYRSGFAGISSNVANGSGGIQGARFGSFTFSADRLDASSTVGALGVFDTNATLAALTSSGSQFGRFLPGANGQRGFLGLFFSFDGGVNRNFGWADITVNPDFSVTLHSFAFEACANESIHVGSTSGGATCSTAPVPEPHSAALVALGAAGLLAYRRRRKAA